MTSSIGIDIGGTAIKLGHVSRSGPGQCQIDRLETPPRATPDQLLDAIAEFVNLGKHAGLPIGIGFCGAVRNGTVEEATNLSRACRGFDLAGAIEARFGRRPVVMNDADAAAFTERDADLPGRRCLFVTLGTGVGSALIEQGRVIEGIELGSTEIEGLRADHYGSTRDLGHDQDWTDWSPIAERVIRTLCGLVQPDSVIVGGGASEHWNLWGPHLTLDVPVRAATLGNKAGVVGAGLAAMSGAS